jgi:Rps23 Pro-64 3,4-dihydroxylase Tpa1-like proline 4-hydroxylase
MFEVFDNFLEDSLQADWYKFFISAEGWSYTGFSTQNTDRFWEFRLKEYSFFTDIFFERIQKLTNKQFILHRVYANGQTHGQCGSVHIDSDLPDRYTFLYYMNPEWRPEWGGSTIFLQDGCEQQISPFFSNRGILFKSNIPHVGLDPSSHFNGLRITVAFKLELIKDKK